jgi:hypothetical protein
LLFRDSSASCTLATAGSSKSTGRRVLRPAAIGVFSIEGLAPGANRCSGAWAVKAFSRTRPPGKRSHPSPLRRLSPSAGRDKCIYRATRRGSQSNLAKPHAQIQGDGIVVLGGRGGPAAPGQRPPLDIAAVRQINHKSRSRTRATRPGDGHLLVQFAPAVDADCLYRSRPPFLTP